MDIAAAEKNSCQRFSSDNNCLFTRQCALIICQRHWGMKRRGKTPL